ncbi:MAG: hypothetical protein M3O66_05285, partial [Verrucomicrobiota bacterium]|nr:hypothetical protein [Verrucomicrobiota bacterium]
MEAGPARLVLDPAKASLKPKIPEPDKRITLFTVFPERLRLSDVNLLVRSEHQDFAIEHLDVELDPKNPGELWIARLQIPNAPPWSKIFAQTSYTNKSLIVRHLVLDDENQFRLIAFDASRIRSKSLDVALDASLAHGTVAGSVALSETARSLAIKTRIVAENVSLDTLRGYLGRPPEFLTGVVERLAIQASGAVDAPRTWDGTLEAAVDNLRRESLSFDHCVLNVTARNGIAALDSGEATKGLNKIRVKGSAELPEHISEFGRSPASFQISGLLPDLQSITAGFAQPLTGAVTVNGYADIKDATLRADLRLSGGPIGWGDRTIAQVSGVIKASKKMPPAGVTKPYYADLHAEAHLDLTDLRSGENLLDSLHADLKSVDALVTVERLVAVRKQNSFIATGEYRLPEDFTAARLQPAKLEVSLGAPDLADYWLPNSANKISGPLDISGQIFLKEGKANGQLSIYGSNLQARNLTVWEVSAQASIANNVVYLNDFTAKLNERDYAGGSGIFSLDQPHHYSGKLYANIENLARLKPILVAAGNHNEMAGALLIDWQGSGDAATFQNSGKLKLTLEKGRYANLNALQANIDATYSPDGLVIPTIFIGSDKMDFQAILEAKGSTLEITKIQFDQGKAKYAAGYISVPFVWKNIGTDRSLFPSDGKVLATFQSENVDLKKLFEDVGAKPLA